MATKKQLYGLQEIIKDIMEYDREARNCDDHLYCEVVRKINPAVLDKPLRVVLNNFNQFELPAYESVGRIRRKVQNECPWLMADDKVMKMRTDNERVFEDYALEVRG